MAESPDRSRADVAAHATARALADELTRLIAELTPPPLTGEAVARLASAGSKAAALSRRALESGHVATGRLAASLAQVTGSLADGSSPPEGGPFLASAADLLARAFAGLAAGEGQVADGSLEAARFELESLLPPVASGTPSASQPDVPVSAVGRRPPST